MSEKEKSFEYYLYVMASQSGIFKIGFSHNPKQRLSSIRTSSPEPVNLLFAIACPSISMAREYELNCSFILQPKK